MKRVLPIVLGVISWVAILGYITLSARYCTAQKAKQNCREIRVDVLDSAQAGFITAAMVKQWLATEKPELKHQEIEAINTLQIEQFVGRRGFVKTVRAYTTLNGVLHIELTQRKPIMRFNTANGYNFYLTEDNYILPAQRHFASYVPVVTGTLYLPFEPGFVGSLDDRIKDNEKKTAKNYLFLTNLINFVKFVRGDDFWNAFVVQIDVESDSPAPQSEPLIRLVPRLGEVVIVLGELEDYPRKLDNLLTFYRAGLPYEGWERYRTINLRYNGMVVCTE